MRADLIKDRNVFSTPFCCQKLTLTAFERRLNTNRENDEIRTKVP